MSDVENQIPPAKSTSTKKRVFSVVIVAATILLTVGLFLVARQFPEKVKELAGLGYFGVFIVSLVSSATIVLPTPGFLVILPLVIALNPVMVALAASTGGIFGEITGYMAGYGGHGIMHTEVHRRAEGWMKRWGSLSVFLFAAIPLIPFDIAGVIAGALKYPLWKFLLIGWAGKSIKFIGVIYAFKLGFDFILRYIG